MFIINLYNDKIYNSFKKLNNSISSKLKILNLNLVNFSNSISPRDSITNLKKQLIRDLSKNLEFQINQQYKSKNYNLKSYTRLLNSNSISSNLKKGYSILMKNDKIIKTIKDTKVNKDLNIKISDGSLEVKVKKIN